MRAVIQRVKKASVSVDGSIVSSIGCGLLVLLGISKDESYKDFDYIIDKIINMRIFHDLDGKMNESISSINGEILIVSQFTLYGDIRKGRRPSYDRAENSENAIKIYNEFIEKIKQKYDPNKIFTGVFGAMMDIDLLNFGPVIILLDSKRGF